jgi:serine/threonine-protein kinase
VLDRQGGIDNQNVPRIFTLDANGASGSNQLKPLLTSSYSVGNSSLSPDGRWIAYDSNESGEYQVYVRALSGAGGEWQVSTAGGRFPKWSRSSKEIFYNAQSNRAVMAAPYTVSGDSFSPGTPEVWSPAQVPDLLGLASYDVDPDGKRFIVLKTTSLAEDAAPDKFGFIFNFFDYLRRVVPAEK